MLVSQAITWTATLILTAALGRHLGPAGFGKLYLAMSFGLLFGVLVEFGIDRQLVRAVARDHAAAGSYLSAAVLIKTILAVALYPIMLATVVALGYDQTVERLVGTYGLTLLTIGLSTSLGAVYQGAQSMLHAAVATVIEKVFLSCAALALFAAGFGVFEIAVAMVLSSTLAVMWKALFISRVVRVSWRPDAGAIRALLRSTPPFLLYGILASVYYRADTVLLSLLTDATVVGWYGAAYRLLDTMVFLPTIVSVAVMFPILAKLSLGSREPLREAMGKGIQAIAVVGVPICVGLFLVADPVVRLIYGDQGFGPAAEALRWLMPGLFALYLNSILTVSLISVNRERRLMVIAGLSCVLNIGLNLVLIPRYQQVAAAAVTSTTELFILGCLLLTLRDVLVPRAFVSVLKASTAAAVMAIVLTPLRSLPVPTIVMIGVAVYVISGYVLRLVDSADVRSLRAAIIGRAAATVGNES